ncbi:MAG: signal recognition particle-docking protein FtsY [Archangium sp.]|nr:signal recognition particle-docking protein FtsY [Archangium sp.]
MWLLLADISPVPPPAAESDLGALLWGGGCLLVAIFMVWLVRRSLRARRGPDVTPPPQLQKDSQELQPRLEQKQTENLLPKVELPPSEQEAKKRAELEAARQKTAELEAQRKATGDAKLKEDLEAAKKDAYRAEKALEVEEKERKKREREEAERLVEEEKKRKIAELERLEAEKKAAEQRKVDAEAGQTLAAGLSKTKKEGFMARLAGLFGGGAKPVDESVLAELEEVLFTADIGVKTASALVEHAREKAKSKSLGSAELKGVIREEVRRIVTLSANHKLGGGGPPHVIMVVGVNGAGKTTTIGKLAAKAKADGKKVLLAAGDTFRAAAAEQLDVWAERAGAELVKGKEESDPASVVFDAVKKGVEAKVDLVIADTAGRLHTKLNLMEELKKVRRVIDKALPGAPHEVLLVLDSTNGQNAIMQARQFHDAVGVTSIALTKLDGTAKGGVIIGICDELKVPVAWAGVGEKVADLRPFEPKEFVEALFDD